MFAQGSGPGSVDLNRRINDEHEPKCANTDAHPEGSVIFAAARFLRLAPDRCGNCFGFEFEFGSEFRPHFAGRYERLAAVDAELPRRFKLAFTTHAATHVQQAINSRYRVALQCG